MEELSLHIEYLLHRYNCVVLPGIGAFLVNTGRAYVSSDLSEIRPAVPEICFNPSIIASDGLLATSYARRLGMSYNLAEMKIDSLASDIKSEIEQGHVVNLGRIGELKASAEGVIEFCRTEDSLSVLKTDALHTVSLVLQYHEQTPVQINPKYDTEHNYYIPVNKAFVKVAAMLCLVMIAALSIWLPANNYRSIDERADYASVVPVRQVNHQPVRTISTEAKTEEYKEPAADDSKYFVIVASVKTEKEANKFVAAHPGDDLGIAQGGKMFRVYVSKSSDRDTLLKTMHSASVRTKFSDAWIWERR